MNSSLSSEISEMYNHACKRLAVIYQENVIRVNNEETKVTYNHKIGDICLYEFDNKNKSKAIVQIVKILDNEQGVAEIKFLNVINDDTGNGFFTYLYETGKTMNASLKYLHRNCVRDEPAAYVKEVSVGEWIKTYPDEPLDGRYHCSKCNKGVDIATGEETPIDRDLFYCPKCGSKMNNQGDEK